MNTLPKSGTRAALAAENGVGDRAQFAYQKPVFQTISAAKRPKKPTPKRKTALKMPPAMRLFEADALS